MSYMAQEKHWRSSSTFGFREFWDERRSRSVSSAARESQRDEEAHGLLAQLDIGQSLTVIWEGDSTMIDVEEDLRCSVCGEALTELRLSALCLSLSACPGCGLPRFA